MERRNSCGNPHSGEAALLKEWSLMGGTRLETAQDGGAPS
jgi:hypothetical protein